MKEHSFKVAVFEHCLALLSDKRMQLDLLLKEQQDASASDGKSTAGDKHETGRAMAQLEQEKTGNQLVELEKMKEQLAKIQLPQSPEKISLGCLIQLNQTTLFLAVALGKIRVQDQEIMVISAASPLGQALLGKRLHESVTINNNQLVIQGLL